MNLLDIIPTAKMKKTFKIDDSLGVLLKNIHTEITKSGMPKIDGYDDFMKNLSEKSWDSFCNSLNQSIVETGELPLNSNGVGPRWKPTYYEKYGDLTEYRYDGQDNLPQFTNIYRYNHGHNICLSM